MRSFHRLLLFALLLLTMVSVPAASATFQTAEDPIASVGERRAALDRISAAIEAPQSDLTDLLSDIRQLRRMAELDAAVLTSRLAEIRSDLDALGPAPDDGTEEPRSIVAERNRLESELRLFDSAKRQLDLNAAEAERLITEISVLRRDRFFAMLLGRGPTVLQPQSFVDGVSTFVAGLGDMQRGVTAYLDRKRADGDLFELIVSLSAGLLLAVAFWIPVRQRMNSALARRIEGVEPLPSRRVLVAATRAFIRVVPALIGGYVLYQALLFNSAIPEGGGALVRSIWFTFIGVMLVEGALTGVFAPRSPAWRVVPLDGGQVRAIRILFMIAALVLGLDVVFAQAAELTRNSSELVHVRELVVTILLALMLAALSAGALWMSSDPMAPPPASTTGRPVPEDRSADPDAPTAKRPWRRLRGAIRLAAIASILACLFGYVSLGHYITTRIFALIALGAVIWLLRALLRETVRLFDRRFASHREDTEDQQQFLHFWITTAIDIVAFLSFVPPALVVLGVEWSDVRGLVSDAFFGFQVGSVRISIAKILTAILLFVGLMYLTRVTQRTAEARFFPRSQIDTGLKNSFKTLIGYVGLIIAFTVGVSALGFNLSNLAIIAGALSVGIGFGLQSIVNNFVSGLILLFERPIKVGDWIVTQAGEGIVQKISVRSTEIETFERSSVIVPNAELISSAVTNWTHRNKVGRLVIPVGISYSLDPAVAIRLLDEVAEEDSDVLSYPAPYVYFSGFGDSAQTLELRVYIRDVGNSLSIKTRLRVAIWKKFHKEGVEIPFPQRDIHIRSDQSTVNGVAEDVPETNGAAIADG